MQHSLVSPSELTFNGVFRAAGPGFVARGDGRGHGLLAFRVGFPDWRLKGWSMVLVCFVQAPLGRYPHFLSVEVFRNTDRVCMGLSGCSTGRPSLIRKRLDLEGRQNGLAVTVSSQYPNDPPWVAGSLAARYLLKEVTILIPHVDCPWATVRHDTARVRDIPARVTAHVTPPPHAGEMLLNACSTYAL